MRSSDPTSPRPHPAGYFSRRYADPESGRPSPIPHWDHIALDPEPWESHGMTPSSLEPLLPHLRSPALVIGAGAGSLTDFLRRRGVRVYGVDQSERMCVLARRRTSAGPVCAMGHRLPFASGRFRSIIVSTGVLDIDDAAPREHVLAECTRVGTADVDLVIGVAATSEPMCAMARQLGLMDDLELHQGRIVALWRDRAAALTSVVAWTGSSRADAEARLMEHRAPLADIMSGLDHVAARARSMGLDGEEHVARCLAFSVRSWPDERYRLVLEALGFEVRDVTHAPEVAMALMTARRIDPTANQAPQCAPSGPGGTGRPGGSEAVPPRDRGPIAFRGGRGGARAPRR